MGMTGGTERRRDRRRREQQERQASQNHDITPHTGPNSDINLHTQPYGDANAAPSQAGPYADSDLGSGQTPNDYVAPASGHMHVSQMSSEQVHVPDTQAARASRRDSSDIQAAGHVESARQQPSARRSFVDSVKTWTGSHSVVPATWADGNQPPMGAVAPGVEPQPGHDIVDPMHHSTHRLTPDETLQVAQAHNPLDDTATDQPVSYREQADAPYTEDTAEAPESIDLRPFDDGSYGYFETETSESLQAALDEERRALNASYDSSASYDPAAANDSDQPDLQASSTAWSESANVPDIDGGNRSAPLVDVPETVTDENGRLVPPVAEITYADDRRVHAEAADSDDRPAKKRPWWFYGLWTVAAVAAVIGWLKPGLGYNWIQGLSGNTVSTVSCKEAVPTASVELVVSQWKHKQIPVELVPVCDGKALLSINPVTQAQADQADQLLQTEGRQEQSGYWLYGVPVQVRSAP